jgi:hypothetical protein
VDGSPLSCDYDEPKMPALLKQIQSR